MKIKREGKRKDYLNFSEITEGECFYLWDELTDGEDDPWIYMAIEMVESSHYNETFNAVNLSCHGELTSFVDDEKVVKVDATLTYTEAR